MPEQSTTYAASVVARNTTRIARPKLMYFKLSAYQIQVKKTAQALEPATSSVTAARQQSHTKPTTGPFPQRLAGPLG